VGPFPTLKSWAKANSRAEWPELSEPVSVRKVDRDDDFIPFVAFLAVVAVELIVAGRLG